MELRYWKQFMETGKLTDYLQYKMEFYDQNAQENSDSGAAGASVPEGGADRETGVVM